MSNYQSPYGFGPVTDAVIDCVADRHGLKPQDIANALDALSEAERERFDYQAEESWWATWQGPAVDAMETLLSDFLAELEWSE